MLYFHLSLQLDETIICNLKISFKKKKKKSKQGHLQLIQLTKRLAITVDTIIAGKSKFLLLLQTP